jgi:protein-tyrosine phosphatase
MRLLFVCTGNICRSPTAEAVVRAKAAAAGLDHVGVASVGTTGYHLGEPPDRRAQQAAKRRGYDLSGLRARQLERGDFGAFDLILGMDRGHMRQLEAVCPPAHADRLRLFMDFAEMAADEVPDPYYGNIQGFDTMLDLIEAGADGLIAQLRARG